uniref:Myosin_tail_1 domain-containing protein n=1 Tax=Macrostomum lignano TaxID=282301 RepID=A0A1I8FIY4_9PLAT
LRDELVAGQAKLDAKETELNELRQQIANKEAENAEKISFAPRATISGYILFKPTKSESDKLKERLNVRKKTSQLIQASENRATAAEAEAESAGFESRRNLEAAENNRLAERAKAQRELEAEMAKVASLHLDNAKLQDKSSSSSCRRRRRRRVCRQELRLARRHPPL